MLVTCNQFLANTLCYAEFLCVINSLPRPHLKNCHQPNEMNPKLLLSYACERTVLPGGARMFKHFATSLESQHLFVYIFWFIHCKFFQVHRPKGSY